MDTRVHGFMDTKDKGNMEKNVPLHEWIHGYRKQKINVTWIQRYKMNGFIDARLKTCIYGSTQIQGYKDPRIKGNKDKRIKVYKYTRIHG